jgi:hypothetical protein
MSDPSNDLSLTEQPAEEPRVQAPAPDEDADPTRAIEEQEDQGWPDEPTTS